MSDAERPIKSAYELAMERLSRDQGDIAPLSDAQKQRLAAISREFRAKVAERQLALEPAIETALRSGDFQEADRLRDTLKAEVDALRAEEEAEKDRVRDEGPAEAGHDGDDGDDGG
ncbi:MAG: hypothetical protein PVF43_07360 [Candidatus Eiseniibacteriota bacterium]|jgi:hypothetical protein